MNFNYKAEPGKVRENKYLPIKEKPLVSIITPFYNAGEYFEQTLNCVLNQTFPWFEWIVVDDGSTDQSSVDLAKSLASTDSRIRLIHQRNGGAVSARKRGIRESTSDIIIFLDADDLIEKQYVGYLYFALMRNPGATWAYTDSVGFGDAEYLWEKKFSSETMKKENILCYSAAIRKSIFNDDTLYADENKNLWEDYQLWLKLLSKKYYPVHVSAFQFWYRRRGSGELSKIDRNPELKNKLTNTIRSAAKMVPDGIRAITFDGSRVQDFSKPVKWEWECKLPFAEEKIRILMLLPHMECGGADKFNLDILKNIDRSRFEIGVITTNPDKSEWHQQFSECADDIFELPSFLDMNDWASFIHYYIYSRDVKIVWNLSSYYGYYVMPWLRAEFPEVVMIDCVHAEGKYWRAGGYPRVSAALDEILEKTFVSNEYTQNIMAKSYHKPAEKMQVIHTGIDEMELNPDKVDSKGLKKSLKIAEKRPVVLFLCRIAPEKRPFLMLEIAKETKKRIPDICFLVVGDGPQLDELKIAAKREDLKNTVYFAGGQNDIKPYYKLSDLFLLCSIKEGLSITTMESMSMRLPVVSADVGSQYELVSENTGRLIKCRQDEAEDFDSRSFPKEEVQDYVNAVCELLGDRETLLQLGENCRNKILDGFTLSCLMNTLESEFIRLLSPEKLSNRRTIAADIAKFYKITEDYLSIYIEYEAKTDETPRSSSNSDRRLQEIYDMRAWKVVEWYHHFLYKNKLGKLLKRFINCITKRK